MAFHTIKRYRLRIREQQDILMPQGAKVLSVDMQGNDIYLHAMVDTEQPVRERRFAVFRSGETVQASTKWEHLGTVQVAGTQLFFHVFEKPIL